MTTIFTGFHLIMTMHPNLHACFPLPAVWVRLRSFIYAFFSLTFHFVFKQPRRMIYLQMVNVYCSLMLSLFFSCVCVLNKQCEIACIYTQTNIRCAVSHSLRRTKEMKKNEHMHTKTFPSDKWSVHFKRPPAVKIWVQYRMTFDFATFCF